MENSSEDAEGKSNGAENVEIPIKLKEIKEKRYINPLKAGRFRNKPCICGSGKKTKKCHGQHFEMNQAQYDELNVIHKKQFGKSLS